MGVAAGLAGAVLGAVMVYAGGKGAALRASSTSAPQDFGQMERFSMTPHLREAAPAGWYARRDAAPQTARQLTAARLSPPPFSAAPKPKIVIVFDDVGLDKIAFEEIMALPGPLTLSFIPYATGLQSMADRARERGDAVMLHLPMTPVGAADPGPMHLDPSMPDDALATVLDWNLNRFSGYDGVNNHMGSAFTADYPAMEKVLRALKIKNLFFLDSLTTADSKAALAGAAAEVEVFARDVFLDPDGDRETIFAQLALVEEIAAQTGFVIAICHPRKETLAVLGPWLTSAPARGFELATLSELRRGAGHKTSDRQKLSVQSTRAATP